MLQFDDSFILCELTKVTYLLGGNLRVCRVENSINHRNQVCAGLKSKGRPTSAFQLKISIFIPHRPTKGRIFIE